MVFGTFLGRFWTVSDRFRVVLPGFCGVFGFSGVVDVAIIIFVVIAVVVVGGGGSPAALRRRKNREWLFFSAGGRVRCQEILQEKAL